MKSLKITISEFDTGEGEKVIHQNWKQIRVGKGRDKTAIELLRIAELEFDKTKRNEIKQTIHGDT